MKELFNSLLLVLMVFSLTKVVYSACPTADVMYSGLKLIKLAFKRPHELQKQFVDEFFQGRFGDHPELSLIRKYTMLTEEISRYIEKAQDIRFSTDFDGRIKEIKWFNTPVSLQEAKIDDKTSECTYYAKIGNSDIFLLSFRTKGKRVYSLDG